MKMMENAKPTNVLDEGIQEGVFDSLGQALPHLQHDAIKVVLLAGVHNEFGHRIALSALAQHRCVVVALELVKEYAGQNWKGKRCITD